MIEHDVLIAAKKSLRKQIGSQRGILGLAVGCDCLYVYVETASDAGEVPDRWEGVPVCTQVMRPMVGQSGARS